MQHAIEEVHVSKNRLEGSLSDTPLERLLRATRNHLVTGTIQMQVNGEIGTIEVA